MNLYINIKQYISCDPEGSSASHIAYPSENYLSKQCNCGVNTIKKYTDILCDIGMLYMKNYGSYLRLYKGKEVVANSNNVYALEEKYLNGNARKELKSHLEMNYGYLDGFYPFCNNLPNNNVYKETDSGDWGEPVSMETEDSEDNDFTVEEILNMPIGSDLVSKPEKSIISEVKSVDVDTFPMNPVKTITIKKKEQNREIPIDVK